MVLKKLFILLLITSFTTNLAAQKTDPFKPDFKEPVVITGMSLVWHDEFNTKGKPDTSNWRYEKGFVRNHELQWYQQENAECTNGVLIITGNNKKVKNPDYIKGSMDWKKSRDSAQYTAASIQTRGLKQWQFGRFVIRARIDTAKGAWPAIWTLGVNDNWPSNGEIDIMEFYRIKSVPTILANVAWESKQPGKALWDSEKIPLADFTRDDTDWIKKFHTWRMDWTKDSLTIFLDDVLLNTTSINQAVNPDGRTPFLQPHYLLLNLALGSNGDDPAQSHFPIKFEVDYVRVYQNKL